MSQRVKDLNFGASICTLFCTVIQFNILVDREMHLGVGGTSIVRLNKGLAVNSLSDPLRTLFTPHFCMQNQSIILVLNIISCLLKILLFFSYRQINLTTV